MNKYSVHFFIITLSTLFSAMKGMENPNQIVKKEKNLSTLIQQKVAATTLSKLSFNENEKILHIGFSCENLIKKKSKCTEAICLDMETLTLLESPSFGYYDKVLSFANWDVIKNPQEMFNNAARVLKEKGQMCVVLPYAYGDKNYLRIQYQTLTSDKWKDRYNKDGMTDLHDTDKLRLFLGSAGFTSIAREIVNKPFIFYTKEKLIAWIKSCPEQLDVIAPEDQDDFVEDLVNNYLEAHWMNQYLASNAGKKKEKIKLYLPYMIIKASKS